MHHGSAHSDGRHVWTSSEWVVALSLGHVCAAVPESTCCLPLPHPRALLCCDAGREWIFGVQPEPESERHIRANKAARRHDTEPQVGGCLRGSGVSCCLGCGITGGQAESALKQGSAAPVGKIPHCQSSRRFQGSARRFRGICGPWHWQPRGTGPQACIWVLGLLSRPCRLGAPGLCQPCCAWLSRVWAHVPL